LKKLLAWPSIASKNWVYRQYDHMVRDGSVVCPRQRCGGHSHQGRFAARNPPTARPAGKIDRHDRGLQRRYVYLDPYEGGKIAVAEACRNLACSGAVPLGATDNLNMANPHKPELFWQIQGIVRGLAEGLPGLQRAGDRRQLLALQSKPQRPD
jgi:phosphoribosylformylglycinamidine (FGAM) synthase-like enzyme